MHKVFAFSAIAAFRPFRSRPGTDRLVFGEVEVASTVAAQLNVLPERQRARDAHGHLQVTPVAHAVTQDGHAFLAARQHTIEARQDWAGDLCPQGQDLLRPRGITLYLLQFELLEREQMIHDGVHRWLCSQ